MRLIIAILFAVLLNLPASLSVIACTVFVLEGDGRHYYGSNFDWHTGKGYVLVNQRGKTKHGWLLPQDPGLPLKWQSSYGSVTFVHFGQGLPKGGMNEAGLAIESLLNPGTEYPQPDDRPYIGSTSHFNQYLLDTCATVEEVVDRLSRFRVATYDWAPGIHFMVADARGDCAVVEFIKGQVKVYRGDKLPVKALTNTAYAGRPAAHHSPWAAPVADFLSNSSRRFQTVADRLTRHRTSAYGNTVAEALNILDAVSAGEFTQWQVVYDQIGRVAHWRCAPDEPLRWIDLKKIDFSCGRPIQALPIQASVIGEANVHLKEFTSEMNRRLVYRAIEVNQSQIPIPESIREDMWRWPQQEICLLP